MQTLVDLGPGPAVPHSGIGKVAVLRNLSKEAADPGSGRHLLRFWPGLSPGAECFWAARGVRQQPWLGLERP